MNVLTESLVPLIPLSFVALPQLGSQCNRHCTNKSLRWILPKHCPRTTQAKGVRKKYHLTRQMENFQRQSRQLSQDHPGNLWHSQETI